MPELEFKGGVGVIGGNAVVLKDRKKKIVMDLGLDFDTMNRYYHDFLKERTNSAVRDFFILGMLPEIDGLYLRELLQPKDYEQALEKTIGGDWKKQFGKNKSYWDFPLRPYGKEKVDAIVLSHAHSDHTARIDCVHPDIPIYCSPLTKKMVELTVENSTKYNDLTAPSIPSVGFRGTTSIYPGSPAVSKADKRDREYVGMDYLETGEICGLACTPFPMDHSIGGATAFLIELSNGKKLLYTGDYRFHTPLYEELYRPMIDKIGKVDVLITEGTKAGLNGASESDPDKHWDRTEEEVREKITGVVRESTGLVCVSVMWKDLVRYSTVRKAAVDNGRTLAINQKTASMLLGLKDVAEKEYKALGIDWPDPEVKVYLPRKYSMLYSPDDYKKTHELDSFDGLVRAYEIRQDPSRYMVQLTEWDLNELIDLYPETEGATFIRSSTGPLDEEGALDEERLINWLNRFKFKRYHQRFWDPRTREMDEGDRPFFHCHASGHASEREIFDFVEKLGPEKIFPVHTEHPERFKERFGDRCVLTEKDKRYKV